MQSENFQLKSNLLIYSTDRIVYVGCIFEFVLHPLGRGLHSSEVQNLILFLQSLLCSSMLRSVFSSVSLLISGRFL